jgi:hypothetical protein
MAYGPAERNLALLRHHPEVASRGEVTGSLERATTDRSD